MTIFLEKNDQFRFCVAVHSINNVPLSAEEVKLFPEE